VITAGAGLVAASTLVTADDLRTFARVPVDPRDPRYRVPLVRDLAALVAATPRAEVVLLGSIASDKYVGLLLDAFGDQLLFPVSFVGRGDMSRGGLLLRAVRAGIELECVPVRGAIRHGARPPRLPRETRRAGLDPPAE
jgi:hypothetical protein